MGFLRLRQLFIQPLETLGVVVAPGHHHRYPFHDKTIHVTCCGRICLHRKKINLSTVFAGQAVGLKEVEEGIWLLSFMNYDLATSIWRNELCNLSTTRLAQKCYLCSR